MNLKGKHLLCTQDWSIDELEKVLDLAEDMKRERYTDKYARVLDRRTFFIAGDQKADRTLMIRILFYKTFAGGDDSSHRTFHVRGATAV